MKSLLCRIIRFKTESALFESSRANAFPLAVRGSLLIAQESAHVSHGVLRWMKLQEPGCPENIWDIQCFWPFINSNRIYVNAISKPEATITAANRATAKRL
ncbi:hypothetical protein [Janthinobacterium sp. DSP2-3-3]|uniref:hypothetical protein n=1 Tax=Janthinobacterium sp. DSP2-3-3 TaxID=2804596 RepID=UPI003CF51B65